MVSRRIGRAPDRTRASRAAGSVRAASRSRGIREARRARALPRRRRRNTTERTGRIPQTSVKKRVDNRGWRPAGCAGRGSAGAYPRVFAERRSTPRRQVLPKSLESGVKSAVSSSRFGMTTRSTATAFPAGGARWRKNSRINRLARLRSTAPPSFREATMPSRAPGSPLGSIRNVKNRPWMRVPRSNTVPNSPRRRIRRSFGTRDESGRGRVEPSRGSPGARRASGGSPCAKSKGTPPTRSEPPSAESKGEGAARVPGRCKSCPVQGLKALKRSGACAPLRGVASGRGGRSSWPSSPGSRASGDGAGYSVETCVCPSYLRTPSETELCGENLDSSEPVVQVSIKRQAGGGDLALPWRPMLESPPCDSQTAVGSPPEVFHNCGKKCGKAQIFAVLHASDAAIWPLRRGRKCESA